MNQFNGTIKTDGVPHDLNGTFLITFHNSTISISGRTFISKEESTYHALPAILQTNPEEDHYRELLSLEMMRELHINNTDKIERLQTRKVFHQWASYGSLISTSLIIVLLAICFAKTRRQTQINIHQKKEDISQASTDLEKKKEDRVHPHAAASEPAIFDLSQHHVISRPKFFEI